MSPTRSRTELQAERRVDLVFEGGGIKGIGLVGAYSVLEEHGYRPQNLAGTSAGAVVAMLLGAGYSARELKEIILGLNFSRLMDRAWEDRLPLVGKAISILLDQGIYEGDEFRRLMQGYLKAKNVETFADLVCEEFADQHQYRYRVRIIASDVTRRELLILPQDAEKLGATPDDLNAALAVRMSMSIPFYFEPVRIRHPKTGSEHLIVDGGILSNFPVWLFDSPGIPEWPTFGLKFVEEDPRSDIGGRLPAPDEPATPIGRTVDFLKGLVETMVEAHDRLYLQQATFVRTITIPTLGYRTTDFNLSRDDALRLFDAGRAAAEDFLKTWNFADYIDAFRAQTPHTRRELLAAELRTTSKE